MTHVTEIIIVPYNSQILPPFSSEVVVGIFVVVVDTFLVIVVEKGVDVVYVLVSIEETGVEEILSCISTYLILNFNTKRVSSNVRAFSNV